jgi:branched-chain amino acid aminotransferase
MFGAGTACIVSPICSVHYQGRDIPVPLDPKNPQSQAGALAARLQAAILAIQHGETPKESLSSEISQWSVVVPKAK